MPLISIFFLIMFILRKHSVEKRELKENMVMMMMRWKGEGGGEKERVSG